MRRPIRRGALTAAALVLALGLTACAGGGGGDEESQSGADLSTVPAFNETPYEEVVDGGSLTTTLRSDLNPQFNVWQADTTADTRRVWTWYNPVLVTYTPAGEPVFNPDYVVNAAAEDVGGNTVVTYDLNPEAVFNDGTPIDVRAFQATWQALNATNPEFLVNSSEYYNRMTSVAPGTSDRQVVVTYDGVQAWWQAPFPNLVHPAAANPETFNQGYLDNPNPQWGAGPYTVANFDQQNRTITLERNPNWWGRPGKLDSRTFVELEPTAAVNAFRNGQVDGAEIRNQEDMAQAQQAPDADIRTSAQPATNLLMFNSTAPNLDDPAVRQAMMQGVDRAQIQEIAFQGLGFSEDPIGSLVLQNYQEGYEDNLAQVLQYDPEAAGATLDAAGWVLGPDGIRTRGAERLTVGYTQTGESATARATAGALVAMMRGIGVDLQVRQVPASEFSNLMATQAYDTLTLGFRSSSPFGVPTISQLYGSDSSLNQSGTGTPELDAQLAAVATLPTQEEQYAAANAAERAALATYGVLPLYAGPEIWVTRPAVANFGSPIFYDPLPETVGFVAAN